MEFSCPYCHSFKTRPAQQMPEGFEQYIHQLISDLDLPMRCDVCGYAWKEHIKASK